MFFCNGVVSSDVGGLTSFHGCQQGLLLFSYGINLLFRIFVFMCFVFNIRNESPGAFRFKCLYATVCLCCQSPALASVEEGGFEVHFRCLQWCQYLPLKKIQTGLPPIDMVVLEY